jgi:hypothetical protein
LDCPGGVYPCVMITRQISPPPGRNQTRGHERSLSSGIWSLTADARYGLRQHGRFEWSLSPRNRACLAYCRGGGDSLLCRGRQRSPKAKGGFEAGAVEAQQCRGRGAPVAIITRARGVIPGCRPAGNNSGMCAKPSTETADQWCKRIEDYMPTSGGATQKSTLTSSCTSSMALRSDLAPEQRAKALQIGRSDSPARARGASRRNPSPLRKPA